MKNRTMIVTIVVVAILLATMVGIYLSYRPNPIRGCKNLTVTVVHADGNEKQFTYRTDKEYLGALLTEEGLITGTEGAYGLMMESVDGERAVWKQDGAYWALYAGENYAATGVDETPIHDADAFRLVYTVG